MDLALSPEVYFLRKSIALAATVNPRTAIYFDTKFWIKLRDVRLGKPQDPPDAELEKVLTSAVATGRVICPFATDIFSELMRAGDLAGKRVLAKLVDELSLGLTLRTEQERVFTELEYFLQGRSRKKPTVPMRDKMWTCPAYVVGFTLPEHPEWEPDIQREIQKRFMDHLYTRGFSEMVDSFGDKPPVKRNDGLAAKLNRLNRENAAGMTSLAKVTREEFIAAVQFHFPTIADILRAVTEAETGRPADDVVPEEMKRHVLVFATVILKEYDDGTLGPQLPTLIIRSGLCAAVRWDQTRQYKKNDFPDHSHAAAALPYFDVFATENSLAHLVQQLKFPERYQTKVVKNSQELVAVLNSLA
ncbi:MAG TPA: hypothetical protein VG734_09940 [Lacunisphaera sp.]|nr:hypothetical protein [Lacunisphaera sp.]